MVFLCRRGWPYGVAVMVVCAGVLSACADGPEPVRPPAQTPPPVTPVPLELSPVATPTAVGLPAVANPNPKPSGQSPASQRPRAPTGVGARPPEFVAAAPAPRSPAPRRAGKAAVTCTTTKQGQASYETAEIVCKNTTELIHTVYLDISSSGYTGLPSAAATQGGYLLAPGESKRVARLKVTSRPTMLAVNTRAVPFKAMQMPG